MFGLELLKRIVRRKSTGPGVLTETVKISDFATQYPRLANPIVFHSPMKKSVTQAILEFMNAHPVGSQFTANELRRYVNVYATPAPGSTDRILRDLRNRAVIGYILVDRRKSLYEVTPVSVTVPDATGDSVDEGEPYFNKEAITAAIESLPTEDEAYDYYYAEDNHFGSDDTWANEGGSFVDEGD
jgi:hypothetical protein